MASTENHPRRGLRKLGLGTAQFGMAYGRFNRDGRPSLDAVADILRAAAAHGFGTIDTAALYGESEAVLGQALRPDHNFRIVTKTPRFGTARIGIEQAAALRTAFQASRTRLRQDKLYGLLAHDSDDLLAEGGKHIFDAMQDLKRQGEVEKIGASVYTVRQIEGLLGRGSLDLIQAPMNVLDQRLIDSGTLREIASRGIELHIRSAFLQGLLLADLAALPPHFAAARPALEAFQRAARAAGRSPAQAALAFLLGRPEIDTVLVGVDSLAQIEEIACGPLDPLDLDYHAFRVTDEGILNPSAWPGAVS
ncbi:MAG TPA: aldo/keto reductase [Stellaceae bacterium]|nr:aldo/keto reductase [Stellaceae bacterium]